MIVDRIRVYLRGRPLLFAISQQGLYLFRMGYGRLKGAIAGDRPFRRYLQNHPVRKLHIGCGDLFIPGWFNTDGFPRRADVGYCDVTRRFPYPDASFDYVLSEHMIEHVRFPVARHMAAEAFRVMKPGARIRLSTPDLDRIVALKRGNLTALESDYLDYALEAVPEALDRQPAFVINTFVRSWGHVFIYDQQTLTALLRAAGFVDIIRCTPGESADAELANVEHHGDTFPRPEFNLVESLVLEARKPA